MLFILDDDIFKVPTITKNTTKLNELFLQIYVSMTKGNNLFVLESPYLSQNINTIKGNFNDTSQVVLTTLSNEYLFNAHLKKSIKTKIHITNATLKDTKQDRFIRIDTLNNTIIDEPTILLCEDMSDANFYIDFVEKFFSDFKDRITFFPISGGGENLNVALNEYAKRNRLILLICDSDKNYPTDEYGNTAVKVQEATRNLQQRSYLDIYILKVHEKENLILPSEYSSCKMQRNINLLKQLENDPADFDFLRFFDFKKGISRDKYARNTEFFNKTLQRHPLIKKESDKRITINLGHSIFKSHVSNIDWNSEENYLYSARKELAEELLSWGISHKRMQQLI